MPLSKLYPKGLLQTVTGVRGFHKNYYNLVNSISYVHVKFGTNNTTTFIYTAAGKLTEIFLALIHLQSFYISITHDKKKSQTARKIQNELAYSKCIFNLIYKT